MKQNLLIIFLLLFSVQTVFANDSLNSPGSPGTGIFAKLDGDNEFTGTVGGTAFHDWIAAGKNKRENYVRDSDDYTTVKWDLESSVTVDTTFAGFQRLTQATGAFDFLTQADIMPDTAGKNLVVIAKIRPAVNASWLQLKLNHSAPFSQTIEKLPNDSWSYMRIDAVPPTSTNLLLANIVSESPLVVDVATIGVHISVADAAYFNGDSIGVGPYEPWSSGVIPSHSYANLYALEHNIDYDNVSEAGELLAEISARVVTDLALKKYPLNFLSGGTNDIRAMTTDGSGGLFLTTIQMIDPLIAQGNLIVWTTIPPSPTFDNATYPGRVQWAVDTNSLVKDYYCENAFVTIIDSDELLDSTKHFSTDDIHVNILGHKIYSADMLAKVPLPYYAETFEHLVTTDGTFTTDVSGPRISEKIHIDWTCNRIVTGTYNVLSFPQDITVYLDAGAENALANLPVPGVGDIYEFNCTDTATATYTCTVDADTLGGKTINGATSKTLLVNTSMRIQYNGEEWRIL